MGSLRYVTLEAALDAGGLPQEPGEPAPPIRVTEVGKVSGPLEVLGIKAAAETGGWLAWRRADGWHSSIGLETLKAMTDFADTDISLRSGERLTFLAQADAGTGDLILVVKFQEEGAHHG